MESNEVTNPSSDNMTSPAEATTNPPTLAKDEMAGTSDESSSENGGEGKAASTSKRKVVRFKKGTVPPALSLEEVADLIKSYYENTGGEQTTYDPLASLTNNSSGSSVFWRKLSTIKNFGLIQEENRQLSITPLGVRVAAPHDPSERIEALKQAFLNIDIFKTAYERYKGKNLPLDEFLVNAFSSNVPKELAAEWVEKFKSSATAAGLLETRNGKVHMRESVLIPSQEKEKEKPIIEDQGGRSGQGGQAQQLHNPPPPADVIRTPIPLAPGRLAHIELPNDWKPNELKKLLKLLALTFGVDDDEPRIGVD